jgi:hypothetical protein
VRPRPAEFYLYKKEFRRGFAFARLFLLISWVFFLVGFVGVVVVVVQVLVSGVLLMLMVVLAAMLYYDTIVCFSFQIHSSCF